jgi:deoxyribose-phosphate aldolase
MMTASPAPFDAATFAAIALSSPAAFAAVLDHTLLKPDATRAQVVQLCHEAAEHRFACAMVNPFWTETAAETLAGTGVPVGVVVGFPLGASLAASKRDETARVLKLGAHDVDLVLNVGLLKSGGHEDFEAVRQDIRGVVELAHGAGAIVKVILETCLLTFEEKLRASEIALAAGADFIKTSTGFSTGGATVDDIGLMRKGLRRYPLARRCGRHARGRRNSHRSQLQRQNSRRAHQRSSSGERIAGKRLLNETAYASTG